MATVTLLLNVFQRRHFKLLPTSGISITFHEVVSERRGRLLWYCLKCRNQTSGSFDTLEMKEGLKVKMVGCGVMLDGIPYYFFEPIKADINIH